MARLALQPRTTCHVRDACPPRGRAHQATCGCTAATGCRVAAPKVRVPSAFGDRLAYVSGAAFLSDLWRFVPSTGQWTLVHGSSTANQAGTYGTLGTASAAAVPGGRRGHVPWTDAAGDVWLFGGYGYGSSSAVPGALLLVIGRPASRLTCAVCASERQIRSTTCGDLALPAASGRGWAARRSRGRLESTERAALLQLGTGPARGSSSRAGRALAVQSTCLAASVGGRAGLLVRRAQRCSLQCAHTRTTLAELNDLWQYNPSSGLWVWLSGSTATEQLGTYGTLGVEAPSNTPGARYMSASWMDLAGNMWLFGGSGYAGNAGGTSSVLCA